MLMRQTSRSRRTLVGLLASTSQIAAPTTGTMIGVVTTAATIGATITMTVAMTIVIGVGRMILGGDRATTE
jgi:uncharacterized protein YacL